MHDDRFEELLDKMMIPDTYWKAQTLEYRYWFRSLIQKIDSSLVFKGLPDNWSDDFFHLCLWTRGYVAVFDTARWGVSFQPCSSITGYDFYYQPTTAVIANPHYQKTLKIGKDCELLKLTPDFKGVLDIIDFYATRLAEASKGLMQNLINAKTPMILTAQNEAQSQTLRAVYDKVQSGESLIIYKNTTDNDEIIPAKEPFAFWSQNYKETFIAPDLQSVIQNLLDSFYVEIGIPVADVQDKRAHLLQSEADYQASQSQARISCWVNTLEESFEKINAKFGLNLEVEYAQREADLDRDGELSEQGSKESE